MCVFERERVRAIEGRSSHANVEIFINQIKCNILK